MCTHVHIDTYRVVRQDDSDLRLSARINVVANFGNHDSTYYYYHRHRYIQHASESDNQNWGFSYQLQSPLCKCDEAPGV